MRNLQTIRVGQQDAVVCAATALLVIALFFGGASRLHEFRLALIELAALPLITISILSLLDRNDLIGHRFGLGLAVAVAALPLVQLVPLPPAIWTSLPGREQIVLALEITGLPQGWLPLTFSPDATWRSFIALLPPLAMFLGMLAIRADWRLRLVHLLLIVTLLSVLLGAAQLASGTDRLYPWATTDAGNVVGFFANRNHLATLCLISIPFATVLGAASLRRGGSRLPLWLSVLYIAIVAVALGVIRSRAGIILFPPVLGASLLAAWVAAGRGRPRPLLLGLVGGAAVAVAAVSAFAAGPLLARFDHTGSKEGRFENWPVVIEAAEAHLPLGSGVGTFDAVYRSVEPLERLDPTFFNQAHNDYLETWLEAGWLGAALIVAFLIWFVRRGWLAWHAEASTQRDLQRAATISISAVLLHSAADYPLRTVAIATAFALCCGLLELTTRTEAGPSAHRGRRRRRV